MKPPPSSFQNVNTGHFTITRRGLWETWLLGRWIRRRVSRFLIIHFYCNYMFFPVRDMFTSNWRKSDASSQVEWSDITQQCHLTHSCHLINRQNLDRQLSSHWTICHDTHTQIYITSICSKVSTAMQRIFTILRQPWLNMWEQCAAVKSKMQKKSKMPLQ